jgi:hypothetical protein
VSFASWSACGHPAVIVARFEHLIANSNALEV